MAGTHDSRDIFVSLAGKITQLTLARTKNDRDIINSTLDELNSLSYKYPVVSNPTKAILLVNHCCTLITPEDSELVLKCCQLISSLVKRQNLVVDGRTLTVAVLWCLQALREKGGELDVLVALDGLLRGCTGHNLIGEVVKSAPLLNLCKNPNNIEVSFYAVQCLEACTISTEDNKTTNLNNFSNEFEQIFEIFVNHVTGNINPEQIIHLKLCITCLRGLQNIIKQKPDLLTNKLGLILGIIKTYMVLGIPGVEFVKPQKLLPSPLSIPDTAPHVAREKGGKMTKQRKPKTQAGIMKIQKTEKWDNLGGYTPATTINTSPEDGYGSLGNGMRTSDSDFSDTEAGSIAKLAVINGRLRQAVLTLFLQTVKLTDRNVIFSFWSSFIPENPQASKHHLITCILKETSNKGRMAALNALLSLLSLCRPYLAQAEKGDNLAFTPFSVILGLTLKELHKCLSLALTAVSVPVLALVLKCFATLVQATPYHRLAPGLLTKVMRNVKPLVFHKDSTVQVTALIVLGCALASEPQIPEAEAFMRNCERNKPEVEIPEADVFPDLSSDDDEVTVLGKTGVPWLLERCLFNLGVDLECDLFESPVPTPVKLESLQIISVMSRNYFETLLAPHLTLVTRALEFSLSSKYSDVQLHAGRAVDFIGQAMSRSLLKESDQIITISQCLPFWQCLLNGSLTILLQSEQQPILRAIGCDCLGSIGPEIFEQLTRDKQLLCISLLFASSRDEENTVKGAAVRALALSVLYPSLREDLGFVVDTTETIYRVLQDENFTVRVKASWALGNLSDALVLNKSNNNLTEEFPKSLILKLLKSTIKASKESDKIKMNTVRALGNLLQLIDGDLIGETEFRSGAQEGIAVLVKSCVSGSNMKVRWNSCHAIGNALKNESLFGLNLQEQVFGVLGDLVVNFRNFKVRINAAAALASPRKREFYKQFYQSIWVALITGLETAQNIQDFNEYKHRDNLLEQICLSLGHLTTIMSTEDLISIKDHVHSEHLQVHMKRVWERLLPENSTILFQAHSHLTSLDSRDLNTEQKETLNSLRMILKPEF